jgi:hypothetical protein
MIRLNTQSEHDGTVGVRYFLAQHMPDVIRRETRNVGIVVEMNGVVVAKFLGEKEPGALDGRSISGVSDAKLYRMWVRHWRKVIAKDDWQARLFADNRTTYGFISGGEVSDTGADSVDDVCSYLFSMLVSKGGLSEVIATEVESETVAEIKTDMRSEMRRRGIMKSVAGQGVRHPVYEDWSVKGRERWQQVTFFQESNDEAWAIEPMNLSTRYKQAARMRAGYLAYLFSDIKDGGVAGKKVNTLGVYGVQDEELSNPHIEYALNTLKSHADITLNWNDPAQRKEYLDLRESVALSS